MAFNLVRDKTSDTNGVVLGNIKWQLNGRRVCTDVWEFANGLGHGPVDHMRKMVRNGAQSVPGKLPRKPRSRVQLSKADTWLLTLYKILASRWP